LSLPKAEEFMKRPGDDTADKGTKRERTRYGAKSGRVRPARQYWRFVPNGTWTPSAFYMARRDINGDGVSALILNYEHLLRGKPIKNEDTRCEK